MITIDPRAGTYFSGGVIVTTHAVERVKERFSIPHKHVNRWITDNLRKAQYIGLVEENGNKARLFGYDRIAFVLDVNKDVVITVYKRLDSPDNLRKTVAKAIRTELTKMERRIKRKQSEVERVKADLHSEIGERMKERQRTRSQARRLALTAYINALHQHFDVIDGDLAEVQREQTKLRKGLVAYV